MAMQALSVVSARRVLNVGGGANRKVPSEFNGWEPLVLDIDPAVEPDIVLDAVKMRTLPADQYDAVYCSHNLEHFYKHDVPVVLEGFLHVLKPSGYALIIVPSLSKLFAAMVENNLDVSDVWYRTGERNAITFHDVLYGWNPVMRDGNLYYAHKCGFTPTSLGDALVAAGFKGAQVWEDNYNLYARAYKGTLPCP